ncbi:FecCD family ABC transporter permease [Tsukamurella paurometabola]|uniref:Iron chelate uptake ABC transporter family permease subunit n=1 Tax=Tsukamurella paurometabola TaxID=2061 RepID=A0ABS5NK68_TSUPA|nr:iron chelate uptake ABC transporter family permease subunit [Tsukamurella paurometabola]MBS4104002.1 iron chelate uptake ABC transporter family permease subunit [Tsukamurella paurometabola]
MAVRVRATAAPVLWLAGLAVLVASIVLAIVMGPSDVGASDVVAVVRAKVLGGDSGLSRIREGIVWDLRLPRSLLAALCGAGLAISGAVLQSLLRNPLADPFVLGVSSGASMGAVAVVVLGLGAGTVGLAGGAFLGALLAFGLVLLMARLAGGTLDRVVLAGIAATQLFAALTSFIVYIAADAEQTRGVLFWLLGSLASASWTEVAMCAAAVLLGVTICLYYAAALDTFTFGEDAAAALGVNIRRTRMLLLVTTALITAVVVSTSGAIGFVGLVLPHVARALVGVRHRISMPTVALLGAIFLVWVDAASRVVLSPQDLPVGVATALVGVPAFLIIMIRQARR